MTHAATFRLLPLRLLAAATLLTGFGLHLHLPALAQVESFMLQRGSNVGPETKVKPTNCITGADGSVTCDTVIENPPGNTPASPKYQPFKN